MFIFKEYAVRFEDGGRYYVVHVCKGILKNKAFVAKYDNPHAITGQVIPVSGTITSNWKDLMDHCLLMMKCVVKKSKKHLVKKSHNHKEISVQLNARQTDHLESALQDHNVKKQIMNIIRDELSETENPYDSDS